ncbi:basic amino acid ABC transporter substrate-binding protein [Rummeliibacillus sp. SL167]|uniref:basic amino acid ABC transporter substrate-binding protein n=1 Tax=Rummeliibacillus sp. SL167 TaxID=2579792 RepID=UPI0011B37DFD|nr:basic amino acid ABC transporter substrate-binding protein [Rummeliibacillus sp. SL167]
MGKRKKLLSMLMLVMAVSMILAACGSDGAKDSSSKDSNKKEKLIAGTEATFAPFESMDDNGKVVGIDVDVLKAIGEETGKEFEVKNIGWEPVFQQVTNGEIDLGASGITITDERKETYDFTEPYYEATQLIVVKKDSKVKSLQDLKDKKIAVQINTTGHIAAQKLQGKTSPKIKAYENQPLAFQEVINGSVDAAIGDNAVVIEYLKNNPDAKLKTVEDDAFEKEYYGFMVKKGNKEVLDVLNEGLKKMKENGKLAKITSQELK